MYEQILYEVEDPIATITLNRPERLNAWTDQMGIEVKHAVAQAEADSDVAVIIITGAGRGFCAGADLKRSDVPKERSTTGRAHRLTTNAPDVLLDSAQCP